MLPLRSFCQKFWQSGFSVILAGVLAALSLPPVYLVIILGGCFPFLVKRVEQSNSYKQAFGLGYLFGLGFYAAGLYWLTNAILLRVETFWWLVPIVAPLCAVPLALGPAVSCLLYKCFLKAGTSALQRMFLFAGLWTLADMSRSILLPHAWWNPILTGFPWNPLASIWAIPGSLGTVLLQPLAWIGGDGLTFLTIFLALSPLLKVKRAVVLCAVSFLIWFAVGSFRLYGVKLKESRNPIVVLVQGNVSEETKIHHTTEDANAILRNYIRLTQEGLREAEKLQKQEQEGQAPSQIQSQNQPRPIVFAWPETAFPGYLQFYPDLSREMMRHFPQADMGLIGSIRVGEKDHRLRNSLFVLGREGQIGEIYDKVHLVPFGEYQPAILPFHVVPGQGLAAGNAIRTLHLPVQEPFGALICYEVVFSHKVVDERDRPSWIINITNDGWYGNSAGPRQHLAAVRMRAVEEGLPIARAANTGITAAYDALGRQLAWLGWGQKGFVVVALPGGVGITFFARFGLFIPFALSIVSVGVGLWRRKPVILP
ncbi:apolipoprotein N-acyltransferase [Entomobacter blattae]|uniref:Apolipoprotein N-acyltransferase n=1 Tax=Entomobacter blattae TaxID=2762277 RepID=A0A7H1NP00_9PROT|nr:apolipoprotein N-acyltransferase [Entomobacter blattae]QNT77510.1 Apolipoprotein N-acyltransferase [Entomobacter blattae]